MKLVIEVMLVIAKQGILAEKFGIHGVPGSFIVSPSGKIVFPETGYTTEPGFRLRLWLAEA